MWEKRNIKNTWIASNQRTINGKRKKIDTIRTPGEK